VNSQNDVSYRKKLAEGFLNEATQDFDLQRFRSCVDNSQLSIENSVKAVLAYFGPVPWTHSLSANLTELINTQEFEDEIKTLIEELRDLSLSYGLREHFLTDYGDEEQRLSPWEIFSLEEAKLALETAKMCFTLLNEILVKLNQRSNETQEKT
jgi:HEPN domain-containing protein